MKPKPSRKSVSFHSNVGDSVEVPVSNLEAIVPLVKKSPIILPFHLLLNLYGMFHYGLTENPFQTLVKGLVNLILLQLANGYLLATYFAEKPTKKKKSESDNVVLLVISATAIAGLFSNAVFVVLILFGAPLASGIKETYVLAWHISMIVIQPLLVSYKLDYKQFLTVFKIEKTYRVILSNPVLSSSFLGVVGTWLGVVPIPLDWDRPWQQWPITLLCGAYGGAFLGTVISLIPLF